jgi:osomolarity two-component system sensor histidine kinase TcsA
MAASSDSFLSKSPAHLPVRKPQDDCENDSIADSVIRYTPIPTVVLDSSLLVRHVSDSYLLVSGIRNRNELVGCHADEVFNRLATFSAHPVAGKALRAALDAGSVQQLKHLTVAGTAWTVRAVPVTRHSSLLHCILEFQDTTAEHLRQLDLEERGYINENFRILVETVRDYAIFMLDPNGNVATWNAGAQAFKASHRYVHVGSFY